MKANALTVISIAIVAIGTYLTLTERWKVLGVMLIAGGTLLGTVVQRRESSADVQKIEETFKQTIEQKMTEVHQEIISAKASLPPASEPAKKLDQIDDSLRDWAAGFVKNIGQRELEVEQHRVSELKTELDKSALWRPVLEFALETIGNAWKAYADQTGASIKVRLPHLPPNLYDRSVNYGGEVIFTGARGHWLIELDREALNLSCGLPTLQIRWLISGKPVDHVAEIWCIDRHKSFVGVSLHSEILSKLPVGPFSTEANYRTELPKSIIRLIEAQILAMGAGAN
ncbi:MAG TPA: hypothetical protein VGN73_02160 [Gemmatimonadaceae bacterium]|jgi:hypothetical protein|nr:hypothetical protein [Gemmatimonadaceae bacterium]